MMKTHIILTALFAMALASCDKPDGYGSLSVGIGYSVNGMHLITDSLCYHNEAGNTFMITEIQWFLSRMELQDDRGEWNPMGTFYIDTDIPESQTLRMAHFPVGHYKTLRFIFGLNEEDNVSGLYSDPPESNMFWPEPLGGGYHYMKLNGRYVNEAGELMPLNIHLGIGQNGDHSEYYQNYFTVTLPIDFAVVENAENQFDLTMIVDNWFRGPCLYDFNEYGSAIMQNQTAQQVLRENGHDVFATSIQTKRSNAMKEESFADKFRNTINKAAPKPHFWTWDNVKERFPVASHH